MNQFAKLLLYSGIGAIVQIAFIRFFQTQPTEGWGGIAQGIEILFTTIVIAVILAVMGFRMNSERRFLHAIGWFAGAFIVIFLLNAIVGQLLK